MAARPEGRELMLFSEIRASAYRIAAAVLGVLAVALLVTCIFFWHRATRANVRADAEAARAQALQTELLAMKAAIKRDDKSAEATSVARDATDGFRTSAEDRAKRAKGYADAAADRCVADPDLMRELAEGSGRIRSSASGLRRK